MNRNEQEMYSNISSIAKSLEKIANALDNNATQTTKDIPGFEGTLDALDNLCNVNYKPEINPADLCYVKKDDFDVHNDYLNDLVQGMNQIEFLQFHSSMNFSFASNDSTAMSDAIYELEYEECLGAIRKALFITGDSDYIAYAGGDEEAGRNFVKQLLEKENTTQPENDYLNANQGSVNQDDPYTYEPNPNRDKGEPALLEYLDGIKNDSDYDIRVAASNFEEDYATKKNAILDYVEKGFGSQGARYTDIIKFAYYLGAHNAPKYDNSCRGYYAMAFNTRFGGHLVQGGKDFLVKGINKNGKERYFTHSSVNKFTDYYKRIS